MTRRRLDPAVRREQILSVALRAFAARPYDEVQVDEIAREAEASRALVNHYFGDKRGLFLAVAREIVARTPRAVRTDLGDLPTAQMVEANVDSWLDLLERSRESALIFLGSGPIGDPDLEALQDELRDRVARRMLANHLGTEELPPEALLAMRAVVGLVERALRDWLTGRAVSREQTRALIVAGILAIVERVLPDVLAAGDGRPGTG